MESLGEQIVSSIIDGKMVRAECVEDSGHSCVLVWSANVHEQIDEMVGDQAMLDFLLSRFSIQSPKMDGRHYWRFDTGWPWGHARGSSIKDAIRNAMDEVKREKEER